MNRTLVLLTFMFFSSAALSFGQRIQNTSDGTLSLTLPFGTLTPSASNTPSSVTATFRVRASNNSGYHVEVTSATFTPTTTAPVSGGSTISAADIGVGIVSVTTAPGFNGTTPRADVVASGFDYNPAGVTGANGLTPYAGRASGTATLADLVNNSNLTILSGNKIHSNTNQTGTTNYLTVTMRFAVVRQYFTPATFTGVINLRIVDGI